MRLYNSLTRAVDRFRPRSGRPVATYVCGITPYDTTHLGHAFTYVWHDTLIRHMEVVHSWPVRYVQNVTDIDDDILRRAAESGQSWAELGRVWTDRFVDDMRRLNARPPDVFPGATSAIDAITSDAVALISAGCAYERAGWVYLRTANLSDLAAGLQDGGRDELLEIAGERGNSANDTRKEDPLDAVLWQAAQDGEPAWQSPWGPGRPGWHVECATLARVHLGSTLDLHGGGGDLSFPHHAFEAHIAACLGAEPFVRFWTHVAMVEKDGAKMAKSVGNLVMVSDLLRDHHPDTIRLYLLDHHYRARWGWDEEAFEATSARTRVLHGAIARGPGGTRQLDPAAFGPRFTAALDDDMNTRAAIEVCLDMADAILEAPAATDVRAAQDVLRTLGSVLGLTLTPGNSEQLGPPWPLVLRSAPDWVSWDADSSAPKGMPRTS